jgi:prepilin-type N-terminal cleavage/methylation domain-containing protein
MPRPEDNRGFSLVELMVTLTVVAIVLAVAYGSFFETQRGASSMKEVVDARQGARAAVQLLERELRMAGSGWGRRQVNGSDNGVGRTIFGVNFGFGGGVGNDSISILGAWDVSAKLRAAFNPVTAAIPCDTVTRFRVGDLVVVTNGQTAHMFQVTGVDVGARTLQHAATSPFNVPVAGSLPNWPAGGYDIGADVFRVDWVSYYVDSTTFQRPALMRRAVGRAPELLAFDTRGMEIWYKLENDSLTRNPANVTIVTRIIPTLHTRVTTHNGVLIVDSLWASVRPRTF